MNASQTKHASAIKLAKNYEKNTSSLKLVGAKIQKKKLLKVWKIRPFSLNN